MKKILLIFIINFICFHICFAVNNATYISISGKTTLKNFYNTLKQRTDKVLLISNYNSLVNLNYDELTIEVNFVNQTIDNILIDVEKYIKLKYDADYSIKKEGNTFIIGPNHFNKKVNTKFMKLKYINCLKMQKIITQNLNDVKTSIDIKANGIIYYLENETATIELIKKYDVNNP